MKDALTLYNQYFLDIFETQDIWDSIHLSNIEQILIDEGEEYTPEILEDIFKIIKEDQRILREEDKKEEIFDLRGLIEDTIIQNKRYYHLNQDDIGKVLVVIANDYLNNL